MSSASMTHIEDPGEYVPGACNIGPVEIANRRRSGHAGVLATVGLLAGLVAFEAPVEWRLLAGIPAAVAAAGYLQAATRFCAAYGWAGVFNMSDRMGATTSVAERQARAADRRMALRIGGTSGVLGIAVAAAAVLLLPR